MLFFREILTRLDVMLRLKGIQHAEMNLCQQWPRLKMSDLVNCSYYACYEFKEHFGGDGVTGKSDKRHFTCMTTWLVISIDIVCPLKCSSLNAC